MYSRLWVLTPIFFLNFLLHLAAIPKLKFEKVQKIPIPWRRWRPLLNFLRNKFCCLQFILRQPIVTGGQGWCSMGCVCVLAWRINRRGLG